MTNVTSDSQAVVSHWWTFLVGGLLLIGVGILVLMNPGASYIGLSIYFAVAIFTSGIMNMLFSVGNRESMTGWGWYFVGGLFDLVVGAYLLAYPAVAAATLPLYVGFWLLFRSMSVIGSSVESRSMHIKGWGWLLVLGIAGLLFAVEILYNPGLGLSAIVLWTGSTMLILGLSGCLLAIQLRGLGSAVPWMGFAFEPYSNLSTLDGQKVAGIAAATVPA